MKHPLFLADRKTQAETAVDTVMAKYQDLETLNEMGIIIEPEYQSLHRLVDEPPIELVPQGHNALTGLVWLAIFEAALAAIVLAVLWIVRHLQ